MFGTTISRRGVIGGFCAAAGIVALIACGGGGSSQPTSTAPTITVNAAATGLDTPVDATPDPMGTEIYFIATNMDGKGVFHVAAAGGTVTPVYVGAPFADPHGISISSDGKTLYVADRAAGSSGGGAILYLPTSGNTPEPVAGTDGLHPSALDIISAGGGDELFFTGTDAKGDAAAYQVSAGGGTPVVLGSGAPFMKLDGIAVSSTQSIYVGDQQAGMTEPGQVFSLDGKAPAPLGPELKPGNPMGMAVTVDGSQLLVSSIDPKKGTSEVTIIATDGGSATTFNKTISANTVSGGVHRARYKDIYAWAGKTQVYSIGIKFHPLTSSTIGGVGND